MNKMNCVHKAPFLPSIYRVRFALNYYFYFCATSWTDKFWLLSSCSIHYSQFCEKCHRISYAKICTYIFRPISISDSLKVTLNGKKTTKKERKNTTICGNGILRYVCHAKEERRINIQRLSNSSQLRFYVLGKLWVSSLQIFRHYRLNCEWTPRRN